MLLKEIRHELLSLHQRLPENHLVTWTSGNVSMRDRASGLVAIKPSGLHYQDLTAESMVVLDPDGKVIEGQYKPSVDAPSHLYIYHHRPDVFGVVHTHSPYATAFAAVGKSIPVYLTAHADEFGQAIPLGRFALIGSEAIGEAVLADIGTCPAIIMKNHGVFTVGPSGKAAVKAAVMVEDIARTVWLALQIGTPQEIPPADVASLHQRYITKYGQ
jgi:L-ribulose-5-phosphate 4-epimerase